MASGGKSQNTAVSLNAVGESVRTTHGRPVGSFALTLFTYLQMFIRVSSYFIRAETSFASHSSNNCLAPTQEGAAAVIDTDIPKDQPLNTELSVAHRAWALTWRVPALSQVLLAVLELLQLPYVPSPQLNQYWIVCPRLQLEPPLEYVSDCPTSPDVGPEGVLGIPNRVGIQCRCASGKHASKSDDRASGAIGGGWDRSDAVGEQTGLLHRFPLAQHRLIPANVVNHPEEKAGVPEPVCAIVNDLIWSRSVLVHSFVVNGPGYGCMAR